MPTQLDIDRSVVYNLRLSGEELGYSPIRAGKTVAQYEAACAALKASQGYCLSYILQQDTETDVNRTEPGQIRVRLADTELLHASGGDFEWVQLTQPGPDLNKWVRKAAKDYIDVEYTLYYTYATLQERAALEECIAGAFKYRGHTRIYTGIDVGTPVALYDAPSIRMGYIYLPAFENIGTGMCQLSVKGVQVSRDRYWSYAQQRWVIGINNATKYLNIEGTPAPPLVDQSTVN